jgi:hypothetical protein
MGIVHLKMLYLPYPSCESHPIIRPDFLGVTRWKYDKGAICCDHLERTFGLEDILLA